MLLIAVLALPLALIIQKMREVERMRRAAEEARAQAMANQQRARKAVDEMLKALAEPKAFPLPLAEPRTREDPR
jgi:hypothetical protein